MPDLSPEIDLLDGRRIPQLGLGVMTVSNEDLPALIAEAVEVGYRHFDTATHYHNEVGVGEGLRRLDFDRDALTITTKVPNSNHGYDEALRAFEASEKAIGRIDLYLVHWPQPPKGKYVQTWKALVRLKEEGRVGSIGVANFPAPLIDEIEGETGVLPVINQIELHPRYHQREAREYHASRGILTESWSPLEQGRVLGHPVIAQIAAKHGRTPAQIVLNWHLANGLVIIPKAADRQHLRDNFASLDFTIDNADLQAIAALDDPQGKFGPDPYLRVSEDGAART
jgi:2,5-diketo-D-gluconate reductase A